MNEICAGNLRVGGVLLGQPPHDLRAVGPAAELDAPDQGADGRRVVGRRVGDRQEPAGVLVWLGVLLCEDLGSLFVVLGLRVLLREGLLGLLVLVEYRIELLFRGLFGLGLGLGLRGVVGAPAPARMPASVRPDRPSRLFSSWVLRSQVGQRGGETTFTIG